jgi:hypothetical protein
VKPSAGRSGGASLLMVDVGWDHSFRLASDLAAGGLKVHVLGGYIGRAWLKPPGVEVLPGKVDLADLPALMKSIDEAVAETGADWVLPVAESILFAAWDHPSAWQPRLLPRVDDPDLRARYRHKQRMMEFLGEQGVPVPEGFWMARGDRAELSQAGAKLGWPMMVKVPDGHAGLGVIRVASLDEAEVAVRQLWQEDPLKRPTLQAWAGPKLWVVGGLFEQGRALHQIAAEVIPTDSNHQGPANRLRTSDHPALLETSRRCFEALKFSGVACIDLVGHDPASAQAVDVNPRPWGSLGMARAAQLDLIGAWAQQLQGLPVALPPQAPAGVEWVKLPNYLWPADRRWPTLLRRILEPVVWRSWSRHRLADFVADFKRVLGLVARRLLGGTRLAPLPAPVGEPSHPHHLPLIRSEQDS